MHSQTESHQSVFGVTWNSVLALVVVLLVLIVGVLFIVFTAQPAHGQDGVPATARQAATMPQFAERLKHAAQPARLWVPTPTYGATYDNGTVDGTTNAWTLNFGYVVSSTFQFNYSGEVDGFDFYTWSFPGDRMLTVDWSITSGPNSGTVYARGTANVSETYLSTNEYGYYINRETISLYPYPVQLSPGTFWLNLQNAVVNSGDPIYWDENNGFGCQSFGCPSEAWESAYGAVPSVAFAITGYGGGGGGCSSDVLAEMPVQQANTVAGPPTPHQGFGVIYTFQAGADGADPAAGLTIDNVGILYGAAKGGDALEVTGTIFRLIRTTNGWNFNRLYASKLEQDGLLFTSRVALGSLGELYGTAWWDISNYYGGAVFQLTAPQRAPSAAFGGNWWDENLLYSFQGGPDGRNPVGDILIDEQGNIYGVTMVGGSRNHGAVYELTQSTKVSLHDFGGAPSDGSTPESGVIAGLDGMYGTTAKGGSCGLGTVYQLGEAERVIYNFRGGQDGATPVGGLVADRAGNLNGTTQSQGASGGGTVFMLSYPNWTPTTLYSFAGHAAPQASLTMDSYGNLYGTTAWGGA